MAPFVVLDVNVLRNRPIVDACIARFEKSGGQIAAPEMALFELTKHPDRWEATVIGSLQLLARCPEAVVLARSTKPLGLSEEATGKPTASVFAATLTDGFRVLLRDIDAGDADRSRSSPRRSSKFPCLPEQGAEIAST